MNCEPKRTCLRGLDVVRCVHIYSRIGKQIPYESSHPMRFSSIEEILAHVGGSPRVYLGRDYSLADLHEDLLCIKAKQDAHNVRMSAILDAEIARVPVYRPTNWIKWALQKLKG